MRLSAILPLPPGDRPAAVFTPLAGQSALLRIVGALAPVVHEIVVPVAAGLADEVDTTLSGFAVEIVAVDESASRAECLVSTADLLKQRGTTHVLLADHRYPLLAASLVDRVVQALVGGAEVVVPVLPVTDTVKVVDRQGTITSTVDRSQLRSVQYPHGFAIGRLLAGDLADAVTVPGDADAVAADLPDDAALLAAVIACR
ncbi:2-C-methyl-D-erythritol 4-phosphate cytidylyltransferase [Mycobacterium sp. C31M]